MNLPRIDQEQDTIYMLQDIGESTIYEKAKAIVNFVDKESKEFEKRLDRAMIDILERNGIKVPSTDKSVLKLAYEVLKGKGKDIEIVDTLLDYKSLGLEYVATAKGKFTIALESGRYLQCCVIIKELKNEKEN